MIIRITKNSYFRIKTGLSILLLYFVYGTNTQAQLPVKDFGYVESEISNIMLDIRYAGIDNFMGRPVDGYQKATAILSKKAIRSLKKVAKALHKKGYGIQIYDAYRPQRAVDHFVRWSLDPKDTLSKSQFYPDIDKTQLFEQGYIAKKSGHSRGSTIDLTLYTLSDGKELDMGSPFDFFGPVSHHESTDISDIQKANRKLLRDTMEKYGFKAYQEEWWHYTLQNEPFPEQYFDFPVQ